MKQSKKDVSLNEKDALQDLLDCEKLLMNYYAAALVECVCPQIIRVHKPLPVHYLFPLLNRLLTLTS